MLGAKYVSDSGNTKIMGSCKVDATYVAITSSCPSSCSLKAEGCYAKYGPTGIHISKLNKEAESVNLTPIQTAKAEAQAIDQSYKGKEVPKDRALRLHVAGDSKTITGTRIINKAIGRWKKRGGGIVWSYTHAWKTVPREEWSNVEVLASINDLSEEEAAKRQGYAPALVVAEHPSEKSYTLPGSDTKWIPCPAQTRGVGCTDCKLCFNTTRLFQNGFGIAFAAHGVKKNAIKRKLNVL
jgi:hypothetical protein